MFTFSTFPTPDPVASQRLATARVNGQDDALGEIAGGLYQDVAARVDGQEALLLGIYKPLIGDVQQRVRDQSAELDATVAAVLGPLTARLETQRAIAETLPDPRTCDVKTGVCDPTTGPTLTGGGGTETLTGGNGPEDEGNPTHPDGIIPAVNGQCPVGYTYEMADCPCGEVLIYTDDPRYSVGPDGTRYWGDRRITSLVTGGAVETVNGMECVHQLALLSDPEQIVDLGIAQCRKPDGSWVQPCWYWYNGYKVRAQCPTGRCIPKVPPPPPPPPPPPRSCPPGFFLDTVTGQCKPIGVSPPPVSPPLSPPGCCPPATLTCPTPNVNVNVTVPPLFPPPPPPTTTDETEEETECAAGTTRAEDCPPPKPKPKAKVAAPWCLEDYWKRAGTYTPLVIPKPSTVLTGLPFPLSQATGLLDAMWCAIFPCKDEPTTNPIGAIAGNRLEEAVWAWLERITGAGLTYHATHNKYQAQYADPQLIPELPALIDLYHKGYLKSKEQFHALARANGHCPVYSEMQVEAGRPSLNLSDHVQLKVRGHWPDWKFDAENQRIGYTDPSVVTGAELLAREQIDSLAAVNIWFKGQLTETALETQLKRNGWVDDDQRKRFRQSREFVAPASDAVRFAVKDVFDPNNLGLAEMIEEFKQQVNLKETLAAAGITPTTIVSKEGKEIVCDWPLFYWIVAYDEISMTQGAEGLHRVRPGREKRFPLVDDKGNTVFPKPMTMDLYRKLAKENNYNPIWRDLLAAISSAALGRIDLKRVYSVGGFGKPLYTAGWKADGQGNFTPIGVAEVELYERFRDLKYVPVDAAQLAYAFSVELEGQKRNKYRTRALAQVCLNYKLGGSDRKRAEGQAAAILDDAAQAGQFIAVCDAEMRNQLLRDAVNGIRRQYLSGELGDREVREELVAVGVLAARMDEFLSMWAHQRTGRRRDVTAQQITQWFGEQQISFQEALRRLVNLKYDEADARRMLRHVLIGEEARTAKELARIEAARQRAAERESNRRQREEEKRFRQFLSQRTDKNLKAWWEDKTITEAEVRATLAMRGMPPADIDRWIEHNRPGHTHPSGGE